MSSSPVLTGHRDGDRTTKDISNDDKKLDHHIDGESELSQILSELQGDQGNPFYVRRVSEPKWISSDSVWEKTMGYLDRLEKAQMIQHPTPYQTEYRTDPNILQVHVTPKGETFSNQERQSQEPRPTEPQLKKHSRNPKNQLGKRTSAYATW